jgi:hypothetical protein
VLVAGDLETRRPALDALDELERSKVFATLVSDSPRRDPRRIDRVMSRNTSTPVLDPIARSTDEGSADGAGRPRSDHAGVNRERNRYERKVRLVRVFAAIT